MVQRRVGKFLHEGYPRRIAWAMAILQVQHMAYIDDGPVLVDLLFRRDSGQITMDAIVGNDVPALTSPRLRAELQRLLPKMRAVASAHNRTRATFETAMCDLLAQAIPGAWLRPVFDWGYNIRA